MGENINEKELTDLAQIGANDSNGASPRGVTAVISVISAILDVTFGASILFSCADNPAQCD